DLSDPGIRDALLELHRRGEIRLASVTMPDVAGSELAHRDERPTLLDESAIVDGNVTYHAILV
ncbi:MAG TPA: hypothetical protein VNO30_24065, partial [Kofleriaceae bacterium]|nr:hypothetical protein [Kofleriaceae bacterium]